MRWEQVQVVACGEVERELHPWVAQEEEGKCQYTQDTVLGGRGEGRRIRTGKDEEEERRGGGEGGREEEKMRTCPRRHKTQG